MGGCSENSKIKCRRGSKNPVNCTADVGLLEQIPTKGGLLKITINTQPNCDFTVKPGSRWIRVLDRSQTSGTAVVVVFIGVNPSISRSSTLEVGGQTITLIQNRSGGK